MQVFSRSAWRGPRLSLALLLGGSALWLGAAGPDLATYFAVAATLAVLFGAGQGAAQPWPSRWLQALALAPWPLLGWAALTLWPQPFLPPHPYLAALPSTGVAAAWPSAALAPLPGALTLVLLGAVALLWGWLLRLATDEAWAVWLLKLVAVVGVAFALYGLFEFTTGNDHVLWLPKVAYLDSLSGSFISRNHAATFLGLGALAATALALLRIGEVSGRLPGLQRLKALWLLVLKPGAWWWLAVAVMWSALLLTSSRAGVAASLLAWVVLLGGLVASRPAVRWWLLGGAAGLLALLALLISLLGGTLANRAERLQEDDGRRDLNQLSLQMTQELPAWGHGLGGWEAAALVQRGPEIWPGSPLRMGNPHNLYVQTWLELGWPGLVGLVALGGLMLACLLQGVMTRRRLVIFPVTGLAALVLVAGHSAVDFPLFVPAVLLAAVLVLAAGLGQSFKPREGAQAAPWAGLATRAAALATLGAAVGACWLMLPVWQAAPTLQALQTGQPVTVGAVQALRPLLAACAEGTPWLAPCQEGLMLTLLVEAESRPAADPVRRQLEQAAQSAGEQALAWAPASPGVAHHLARLAWQQGQTERAAGFLVYSVMLAPFEFPLAERRLPLVLTLLEQSALAAADRDMLLSNLGLAWQAGGRSLWRAVQAQPEGPARLAVALAQTPGFDPAQWQPITRRPWPLGNASAAQ